MCKLLSQLLQHDYPLFSDMSLRPPVDNTSVHVINLDIQDNHEEATLGAFLIWELITVVSISSLHVYL